MSKIGYCRYNVGTTYGLKLATVKKISIQYSMNMCSMNTIWMYSICIAVILMKSTASLASLPFINPLPWPHGIVKRPSVGHFRSNLGTFHLLFYYAGLVFVNTKQ